jgi:alpha-ketoglutaric semialdehyde dehydrogenase
VRTLGQFIGGEWLHEGADEIADLDPSAPSTVLATFRGASADMVAGAVASATAAFKDWSRTPAHERAGILERVAARLTAQADDFGREIAREQGKTLAEASGEVLRAADVFRYFASHANLPAGELFHSPRGSESIQVLHQPLGAVAAITPWNFPLFIPAFKLGAALAYGNTVVWKPATITPIAATRLVDAFRDEGVPPGAVNLVLAPGPVAEHLITSPGIEAVSFTGSTAVGRRLAALAAEAGKPFQAEMGGKNAAVVLADADLDRAADDVVKGAMSMAGQKCTATSRAIVAEQVYDDFCERLVERVERIRTGPPLEAGTSMGPLASQGQLDQVSAYVREAIGGGARVLTGGAPYADGPLADGYFFPPSVLEVKPADPIWREEVFGPVLALHPAGGVAEAFELCNQSSYGLSAAVFTQSLDAARRAIEQVEVGMLHINSETTGADPHVPFGGIKDSGGHSRELGRAARDFYTRIKTVYVR